jgi:hypothetical protein
MLETTYRHHLDVLGRSREVRRFVLSLLLVSRFHLTSRPFSKSNASFFMTLGRSCDALLNILRDGDWQSLDPSIEAGISQLTPTGDWPSWETRGDIRDAMGVRFRQDYRRFFWPLSPPFSRLAPSEFTLDEWPEPRKIFIGIGPNIGIGDELIFFELIRRLRDRFPKAWIRVSSSKETLWSLAPQIDEVDEPGADQLIPFVNAQRLISESPESLLVFVEFASESAYRQLESVAAFPRFVYADSGIPCLRLVDQEKGLIADRRERRRVGIYAALDSLSARAGLDGERTHDQARRSTSMPNPTPKILLNPLSSKDFQDLSPLWWRRVVEFGARDQKVQVEVFAGPTRDTAPIAQAIVASVCEAGLDCRLLLEGAPHSVSSTLRAAADVDLVLGVDTFTGHVGVLTPVRCVTILRGSEWDAWRVPSEWVLNAYANETPEKVGSLVARLLWCPPAPPDFARSIVSITRSLTDLTDAGSASRTGLALGRLQSLCDQIGSWMKADPDLSIPFTDPSSYFLPLLAHALANTQGPGGNESAALEMLRPALDSWRSSNLYKYAKYLSLMGQHATS